MAGINDLYDLLDSTEQKLSGYDQTLSERGKLTEKELDEVGRLESLRRRIPGAIGFSVAQDKLIEFHEKANELNQAEVALSQARIIEAECEHRHKLLTRQAQLVPVRARAGAFDRSEVSTFQAEADGDAREAQAKRTEAIRRVRALEAQISRLKDFFSKHRVKATDKSDWEAAAGRLGEAEAARVRARLFGPTISNAR